MTVVGTSQAELAQIGGMAQTALGARSVSTVGQPQRIPLDQILLPPNAPAGLSPWILFAISHELRNAGRDVRDPIVVQRLIGLDLWRIVDGRHRFAASLLAGAKDILATEVP